MRIVEVKKYTMTKVAKNFIGIDNSKNFIDVAVIINCQKDQILHQQFKKDKYGLQQMLKWMRSMHVSLDEETVCCMEYTGLYNKSILTFLQQFNLIISVEMSYHIKLSLGLQRGKSDKIDAKRIASFAYKNRDEIKRWEPIDKEIEELKNLVAQRERVIQAKKQLTVPVRELEEEGCKAEAKQLMKLQSVAINGLEKTLEKIEASIRKLIVANLELARKVKCMTSIVGIGEVTAWNFIIYTNGFKRLRSGKQLACYCGLAPFTHESGSSIKGKTRVSHMANKKLKTLLHMGALAAVIHDSELHSYYQRKVVEGKNKMSILNAVRNKLILRIAAVIREDREYLKVNKAA